jgi:Putative transposase/Transposase zinc-binding domain
LSACNDCGHTAISYNSCRNRHCPKCQAGAARAWLEARAADLLPVAYFHIVFTLPAPVAAIALQNKAIVYALLFEAAAETLKTIAADPRHLGAEIGATMVLHSWGQTLTHHPHVHCIVPGGGLAPDGKTWIACRPGFFLPVRVLARLYRRLFLDKLRTAHRAGKLHFFNELVLLADTTAFDTHVASLRRTEWVVYAKAPFAGPEQVLAYLSRYTHRIAISNRRLVALDDSHVAFTWRDYARGKAQKIMRLDAHEFVRRFLLHVLPDGFQRIRHYGFLANGHRRAKLAAIRSLLAVSPPSAASADDTPTTIEPGKPSVPCPCCGGTMTVIEVLPGTRRRHWPRLDTS